MNEGDLVGAREDKVGLAGKIRAMETESIAHAVRQQVIFALQVN